MGWRSVVLSSAAKVSVKDDQLLIEGEKRGRIPIEDVRTLMIESRTSTITTYALSRLAEAGVCVYVCDEKHLPNAVLQPIGRHSRQKKQILLQLAQGKPHLKRMWREIVIAKIRNQAKCLSLCGVEEGKVERLLSLARQVQSGDATNAEAQAAALYFKALFGEKFVRSADCGINAALNYGYAIIRGYLARIIANCGFEPCLGIHHHSELNNFNFADDLIEPFRPLVDLFVSQNLQEGELSPARKKELCNVLNFQVLSGDERHSVAYAAQRLVHSVERCFECGTEDLLLPAIEALKRHEYE